MSTFQGRGNPIPSANFNPDSMTLHILVKYRKMAEKMAFYGPNRRAQNMLGRKKCQFLALFPATPAYFERSLGRGEMSGLTRRAGSAQNLQFWGHQIRNFPKINENSFP
jgi:hypothetical protein